MLRAPQQCMQTCDFLAKEGSMTDDPQHTIPSGTSPAHEVRQLCDAFESEWKTGQPKIESYVADADASLRSELLQALLFTELRLRFGSGETPLIEEYQERFPDHKSLVATAFAIVGSEDPIRSAT